VEYVPPKTTVIFTIFQLVYLLICFGITWIPIAAEYEELDGVPHEHTLEDEVSEVGSCISRPDAEILDELTTNRGELKHRTSSLREETPVQVPSNAIQPSL